MSQIRDPRMSRALVVLSGGLDSTTALFWARDVMGFDVIAASFTYGQKHRGKEMTAAQAICQRHKIDHVIIDLPEAPFRRSSLTSQSTEIPEGHYTDESMKSTVVPNRNLVLLSVASALAISRMCGRVIYGAHGGDHAIYPDCRPEFVAMVASVLQVSDWNGIQLMAPFLGMDKSQIVRLGDRLGVPFADTWSCYKGEAVHCGVCGTCVERREAFQLARIPDPTRYA